MLEFSLRGERGRWVTVKVSGYSRASSDAFEINLLDCTVEVGHGGFRGQVAADCTTTGLVDLVRDLDALIEGARTVATFGTSEGGLELRVEMGRTGHVMVSGTLRECAHLGPVLTFEFESDRGFLASARSELKLIVREFPHPRCGRSHEAMSCTRGRGLTFAVPATVAVPATPVILTV